jgi:hypothetical protein
VRRSILLAVMTVVAVLELSPAFACGIDEPSCSVATSPLMDVLSQPMTWWVALAALVLMLSAALIGLAWRRAR